MLQGSCKKDFLQCTIADVPSKIVLDTSAFVALVSEITNNTFVLHEMLKFEVYPLQQQQSKQEGKLNIFLKKQIEQEFENCQVNKGLKHLFNLLLLQNVNTELFMPKTAFNEVCNILNSFAGPNEHSRANSLLKETSSENLEFNSLNKKITIIDDDPSNRVYTLVQSKKIKQSDKMVFGTADKLNAPILTSDLSFISAANAQGVDIYAMVFTGRSLFGGNVI